jgi:hypothetical protein
MNEVAIRKFFKAMKGKNPMDVRAIKKPKDENEKPIVETFFISKEDEFVKKVIYWNKKGFDIYAGYNDRKAGQRSDINVISNKYFVIDIDFDKASLSETEIKAKVDEATNELELKYSKLIKTGGGYHIWYPVPDIKDINLKDKHQFYKILAVALDKRLFGGQKVIDPSVCNPERVMRVWGTINQKPERNNAVVEILEENAVSETDASINYQNIENAAKQFKQREEDIRLTLNKFVDFPLIPHLLSNELPSNIQKNDVLFKNLAFYIYHSHGGNTEQNRELLTAIAKKQNHNPSEILGWFKKAPSGEFNLAEMIQWNNQNMLNLGSMLPSEKKNAETAKELLAQQKYERIMNNMVSFPDILEKDIPEPSWIIEDILINEGITMIGGQPGTFKTFIGLDIALAIFYCHPFLDEFSIDTSKELKVCYLDEENGEGSMKRRLNLLNNGRYAKYQNNKTSNEFIMFSYPNLKMDIEDDFKVLRKIIEVARPNVLVIDSFIKFFSGDENHASEMRRVTEKFGQLKNEYGLSIILLHHLSKTSTGKYLTDFRGSGEIAGALDMGFTLEIEVVSYKMKVHEVKNRFDSLESFQNFSIKIETESDGLVLKRKKLIDKLKSITLMLDWKISKRDECKGEIIHHIVTQKLHTISSGKNGIKQHIQGNFKDSVYYEALNELVDEKKLITKAKGKYDVSKEIIALF